MHAQELPFSFDQLYPANFYTKAHTYCVQVWGMLDELAHHKKTATQAPDTVWSYYLIDIVLGQLVLAHLCIKNIIAHNMPLGHDDIIYLSRIIGTIQMHIGQLPLTVPEEKRNCLSMAVDKLRKKVELLLQGNHAVASACH
jgi:hypothetical protein